MNRELLPVAMIVLIFAIAFYADPLVKTDQNGEVFGQWRINGAPSGMVSKTVGVYLIPVICAIVYFALLIIPKIEVYKHNLDDFADQFWGFKVIAVFAMGVIYVATLLPNMGAMKYFDPFVVIVPAVSLMFFYVGYMLNFTKRNYFVGIHTPWTLSDEKIWEKTNKLAGKLFWFCGALALFSLATPPSERIWMLLLPVVMVTIAASIYSLWEYKKTKRAHARAAHAHIIQHVANAKKGGKKRK